jgi:hypothetical protein
MIFASHDPKVVFSVLVTVLHLNHVARDLRLARTREIPLILLAGVDLRPTHRMSLLRHSSHTGVHHVPFLMCGS